MTDIDTAAPEIVEISPNEPGVNPLNTDGPTPEPEKTEAKPEKAEKPSIDDSIKKAMEASKAKEAPEPKEPPKPKEAAPVAAKEPAAPQPVEEKARTEAKPSEGRKYDSAPSRFLPEASAKWANVPNEIKTEVHRAFEDFEREKATYQEHVKFREELREYEELGKQHNTTIKEALGNYVSMERALKENPTEGFQRLLSNMGIDPQRAISHILQAYNVQPQVLARHIAENPQMYAPQQRQMQAPQAQVPPQVSALEQKVAEMERKLAEKEQQEVVGKVLPIIKEFASTHTDYWQLEDKIAQILKSGIIEQIHGDSLQPKQRLSEAYRMAGGQLPSRSGFEGLETAHSPAKQRPVNPDAGKLSIGGSPAAGEVRPANGKKKAAPSIDDALANAIRRAS